VVKIVKNLIFLCKIRIVKLEIKQTFQKSSAELWLVFYSWSKTSPGQYPGPLAGWARIPLLTSLHLNSSNLLAASVSSVMDWSLQSLSAMALALGKTLDSTVLWSTYSDHMQASPPRTSSFCSELPLNLWGSHLYSSFQLPPVFR